MKVYTRSKMDVFQSGFAALGCGIAFFAGLSWLSGKVFAIPIIITSILSLIVFILIYRLFSSNSDIRFELHDDGTLKHFNKNNLIAAYKLSDFMITWQTRIESGILGSHNITLKMLYIPHSNIVNIDAGPLREAKFKEMFSDMQRFARAVGWEGAEKAYNDNWSKN